MAVTDKTINELTEAINKIIESSLTESVLKRLDSFGCVPSEDDVFVIGFSIQKVEQTIKNECNVAKMPEGLTCPAVEMVCGEVLSTKYRTNQLDMESLDLDGALASVTVGGASVSFDKNTSDEGKLNMLISALTNTGRSEFACYRNIKW